MHFKGYVIEIVFQNHSPSNSLLSAYDIQVYITLQVNIRRLHQVAISTLLTSKCFDGG